MKKTLTAVSVSAILLLAGCSDKPAANPAPTAQNSTTAPVPAPTETKQPAAGNDVISLQKADLDGDGKTETVTLLGLNKPDANLPLWVKEVVLRIEKEGQETQEFKLTSEVPLQPMKLQTVELTGDVKQEIIYQVWKSYTAGGTSLMLFTPDASGKYQEMALQIPRNPEFRLSMQNSGKYSLYDSDLNKTWTLTMDEDHIKATGNPNMSGQKPQLHPPLEWTWIDVDGDGKPEIVSRQGVFIGSESNILVYVQRAYKWDGKDVKSQWKNESYTIQPTAGVKLN